MKQYSIWCGKSSMDSIYLELWLLGNTTNGYKRKGSIVYTVLTAEQADFLRSEGWSVRER